MIRTLLDCLFINRVGIVVVVPLTFLGLYYLLCVVLWRGLVRRGYALHPQRKAFRLCIGTALMTLGFILTPILRDTRLELVGPAAFIGLLSAVFLFQDGFMKYWPLFTVYFVASWWFFYYRPNEPLPVFVSVLPIGLGWFVLAGLIWLIATLRSQASRNVQSIPDPDCGRSVEEE